jgi:hypothetical protein
VSDKKVERLWKQWSPQEVVDPIGLDQSIAIVGEKLCSDAVLRKSVRVVLGFMCEGKQREALARLAAPSHLPPDLSREQDVRDVASAAGVEAACDLLTDQAQLREVRDWLNGKESETEDDH